jgi:imidazolonepropionase-like amidohydrolase
LTDSVERKALEKRKADFVALHTGQATSFQKAGIVFGFSTLTAKPKDIPSNLRRIIKAGLTEDQALAALTTNPASLLGLSDRLGSIDAGKVANLVISRKPYFDEKSKVQYVFVDGVMYKIESKEPEKPAEKKADKP